jgi:predicted house-cleaning noncanonical NTP pyrophosphatase (MazG superfamily)
LDDAEFNKQLRIKLLEEAHEVVATKNRDHLIDELGDLYEVIDTIADLHGISKDEILRAQSQKREEKGGFSSRTFVEVAEHPAGSYGEKYCLADPEKYPEVCPEYHK